MSEAKTEDHRRRAERALDDPEIERVAEDRGVILQRKRVAVELARRRGMDADVERGRRADRRRRSALPPEEAHAKAPQAHALFMRRDPISSSSQAPDCLSPDRIKIELIRVVGELPYLSSIAFFTRLSCLRSNIVCGIAEAQRLAVFRFTTSSSVTLLLHWQITWFRTLQDLVHVSSRSAGNFQSVCTRNSARRPRRSWLGTSMHSVL